VTDQPVAATDCSAQPFEPDFAARSMLGWHVLFGFMTAATLAVMAGSGHAAVALVGLGILTIAYLVVVVPFERRHDLRLAIAFVLLSSVVLVSLEWQDRGALVLLFTLYPLGFVLLPRMGAIVATIALTVAFTLVLIALDGWTRDSWLWNGLAAIGYIAFALVMGLFIDGLVRESRRNRELVQQLRRTHAELARAERESGALAERERMAREIHDTLAQDFTSIVMLAQAGAAAVSSGDGATGTRRFTEIETTAREALGEARALVGAMTPPALAGGGLDDAVTRLTDRYAAETGTVTDFHILGAPRPLGVASAVAALRATQEALANARKHSGATHISVVLTYDEDGATVAVTDDGSGFDPAEPRHGYGLDGLSSRVEAVGGIAEIDSSPGAGTRVRVRVP
jgi:signal transduction histidine kinase